MGSAVKWGIILALAVSVFNVVWVLAGMHTSMAARFAFLAVVILLNIVAVILALRETAASNGYGGQVAAGLVLGIVGGVLIFASTFLTLSRVFPDALAQRTEGFRPTIEALPMEEEQKQATMAALAAATPSSEARAGALGTLFTSLIGGAIAGAFLRKKG